MSLVYTSLQQSHKRLLPWNFIRQIIANSTWRRLTPWKYWIIKKEARKTFGSGRNGFIEKSWWKNGVYRAVQYRVACCGKRLLNIVKMCILFFLIWNSNNILFEDLKEIEKKYCFTERVVGFFFRTVIKYRTTLPLPYSLSHPNKSNDFLALVNHINKFRIVKRFRRNIYRRENSFSSKIRSKGTALLRTRQDREQSTRGQAS